MFTTEYLHGFQYKKLSANYGRSLVQLKEDLLFVKNSQWSLCYRFKNCGDD